LEESSKKEAELKKKEEVATKAADELKAALAELQAQQDAYDKKTQDLKKKSTEGGVVSQGRAKNELAQHLAEDVRRFILFSFFFSLSHTSSSYFSHFPSLVPKSYFHRSFLISLVFLTKRIF